MFKEFYQHIRGQKRVRTAFILQHLTKLLFFFLNSTEQKEVSIKISDIGRRVDTKE